MEDLRLDSLEQDMQELKVDLGEVSKKLDEVLELVYTMNTGIYGDKKNKHKGVLEKQEELEKEIETLKVQIKEIHEKDKEQDLSFNIKKTFKQEMVDVSKDFIKLIIQFVGLYLVLKGIMPPDGLL
jgi:chromosome segregation ATPase